MLFQLHVQSGPYIFSTDAIFIISALYASRIELK